MSVHIDAVLEAPYYTIRLPDSTITQTSWDNLMTLAEHRKKRALSGGRARELVVLRDDAAASDQSSSRGWHAGRRDGCARSSSPAPRGADDDWSEGASRRDAPRPPPSRRGRSPGVARGGGDRLQRSRSRGVAGPCPSPSRRSASRSRRWDVPDDASAWE